MELYAHPFSSYSQKVLIALYENATTFEFRMLDAEYPDNVATLMSRWQIGKFPLLMDNGRAVFESTIIIEYLQRNYPGKSTLEQGDIDERNCRKWMGAFHHSSYRRSTGNSLADYD